MQPPPSQDPNAGPWMRKYLSAILADPTLQATHAGSLPVWLEQQIDPALERGQGAPPRITIQQAVNRCPALVLLGPAGSGKSTLLRQLVRELAQEALNNPQAPLPLYVPLTFFAGSIEGTLAAQARMRGPTLATLALTRPCILIVDALNDLPPAEQVPVLGMLRRALSSLGPQGRWIIACRSEAWGLFDAWLPGGRFQVWRVRPWSDQAIANAVQRQGNPAGERLLRFPGAIELARRPRWLGAFLQLGTAPEGEGTRAAALGGLPGPLLLKWIRATAAEAARTHCLSDLCPEIAVTLLQDLGVMFQRDPLLNRATIANMVADAATAADLPVGDVQALLEALALLHPAGDDEWTFRSPLLGDLNVALDLCADAKELGLRVEERALSGDTASAPSPQSSVLMAPRTALALLFGMLPSAQPLLRMLIRAGAWEATQEVLDANVGPDEALAALEETGQIDSATAAALGRAWAQGGSPEVAIALLEWTVRQGRDD
ncbi:MAG: NACHT domain-containing protein, partial [Chloroflexota bacterium]|nr:NACHT domain-containing protein [Chloroflexota bacterium]